MLIGAEKSSLLIIDMQERLLPAMAEPALTAQKCQALLTAAKMLDVPVTASEQYPKGLGHTVAVLREEIGNAPVFAKTAFSCWRDEALKSHLINMYEGGRPQIVVCGIEAHVCVLQTAIDLAQAGFAVCAVSDASSSRAEASHRLAFQRMQQAGVQAVNAEMVLFEWLGKAGTAEFKSLSALIK